MWRPNPGPQEALLSCPAYEVFYGGARGGGKTDSLLMDYAQHVGVGWGFDWKGIIFRKTYKQLDEIISRSKKYFRQIFPDAEWKEGKYKWVFKTGEELKFRHLERDTDAEHYQGHEYPYVGFEELTNWALPVCYEKLKATCRSTVPGIPKKIRSNGNPLGPGHQWVKAYFIDQAPPGQPIFDKNGLARVFIPAKVYDNLALVDNDPMYVQQLEAIADDNLRKAWLNGDWDVVAGAYFADVWDRRIHVIKSWLPPKGWICYRSFDWGSAKPFSVGWWTISPGTEAPDGKFYPRGAKIRFAEWYGCKKGEVDVGLRLTSKQVGKEILKREAAWREKAGVVVYPGPADPAIFASDDGPSVADNMKAVKCHWEPADNTRIAGWEKMRELMIGDPDELNRPTGENVKLYIMDRCVDFLRTVPVIQRDENLWDDIDTEAEDHIADEARYACMFKGPRVKSGKKHWK